MESGSPQLSERITEASNPLTESIDRVPSHAIPGLLAAADRQMFDHNDWGQGLAEPAFRQQLTRAQTLVGELLKNESGSIILSGAGTSGRLALQAVATRSNRGHSSPRLSALMAGGVDAFFFAKERVEDLPAVGKEDFEKLADEGPVCLIGISCGLSAAYVAGQIDAVLQRPNGHAVLIGFNPVDAAPDRLLPSFNESFRSLLTGWMNHPRFILLNPLIGPEPITGSTRMKGGSATKILLDILLSEEDPDRSLQMFEAWHGLVFEESSAFGDFISASGKALYSGGSIRYATKGRDSLMALLDASECPPTFGADPSQVWPLLRESVQAVLPGFDDSPFLENKMNASDVLFYVEPGVRPPPLPNGIRRFSIALSSRQQNFLKSLSPYWSDACRDLWLKWVFNAISTGSFICAGKVFRNRMIDLKISNIKLWERALRLTSELAGSQPHQSKRALLAAIQNRDEPMALPIEEVIQLAVHQKQVIARAALIAKQNITVAEAKKRLSQKPKLNEHF